jgi:Ca2+-binding RTX toxin-like protein
LPVFVDGGAGNDALTGGGGSAVLLGGEGEDFLYGGKGPSLLIGGLGSDWLIGGREDDALIGGRTNIDDTPAALAAAIADWAGPANYDARAAALDTALDTIDDNETDRLKGSSGRDLFFDGLGDDLTDVQTNGSNVEEVL